MVTTERRIFRGHYRAACSRAEAEEVEPCRVVWILFQLKRSKKRTRDAPMVVYVECRAFRPEKTLRRWGPRMAGPSETCREQR